MSELVELRGMGQLITPRLTKVNQLNESRSNTMLDPEEKKCTDLNQLRAVWAKRGIKLAAPAPALVEADWNGVQNRPFEFYDQSPHVPAWLQEGALREVAPADRFTAMYESFRELGMDEQSATAAANGHYGSHTTPAPIVNTKRDAWDEYAEAQNLPAGYAAIMREGRG